ncbi:unnamed protein product, partial [Mesorhabditis belari]|uniref:Acyltransferase n=1 Tax=Mesorhabditis belari TaxID=2138241 RepID=A0AAF3F8A5_9BILA
MVTNCSYHALEEQKDEEKEIIVEEEKKIHSTIAVKEFREDIALLRALAILAVLGYHFWPTIFPLGFIGVDIFFVISGFLIMRILESLKNERLDRVFLSFYYRRVKRILPLYYLIVFFIGFSMLFLYTAVWAQRYFRFYFGAIFFFPNFQLQQAEGNYFSEATEKMPFLHSWSLGVEMQFYLVAPFLFYISKMEIAQSMGYLKLGPVFLLCFLLFSLYFHFFSLPIVSFYHPLARGWQFLCGMITTLYTESMKTTLTRKQSDILSVIYLINTSLLFFPFPDKVTPPHFFQILITISSAGFILFSTNCSISWSRFRLGYIARISYALYLVHFPILRFTEYLQQYYNKDFDVPLVSLVITFLLSIVAHHFFEAPLLRVGKLKIFLSTLKYFALCLLIGFNWKKIVHPDCAQKSTISENQKFIQSLYRLEGGHFVDDGFMRPSPPFGHYLYEGDTGKLKIMILGNSWATGEAHLIRNYFSKKDVYQMHLFSQPGHTFGLHGESPKPDYVFLLVRYNNDATNRDLTNFQGANDQILDNYLRGIHNISLFTKKLFLQTHQPFDCQGKEKEIINRFVDSLQKEENMQHFNRPFNVTAFYNSSVHQRLKIVFEKCSNCYPIDIAEPFIDFKRKELLVFDVNTQLLYIDTQCHLTVSGLKMIEKPLRLSIENGINSKKSNT